MVSTFHERENRRLYNERSYEWLKFSGGADRECFWKSEMTLFMNLLGKGKNVVELGCGPATDGKYLLAAGCKNVISIDNSEGMLKMASEVLAKVPTKPILVQMDMHNLAFPDSSFDGFWATASFLHLEDPWDAIKEAYRILKINGVGLISVKEGIGEEVNPKTGYYFHYYQKTGLEGFGSYLSRAGFTYLGPEVREAPNHNWLTFMVQK